MQSWELACTAGEHGRWQVRDSVQKMPTNFVTQVNRAEKAEAGCDNNTRRLSGLSVPETWPAPALVTSKLIIKANNVSQLPWHLLPGAKSTACSFVFGWEAPDS